VADALFKAAISGQDPRAVIDEVFAVVVAKDALGDGHADAVGDALAEGTGRDLHGGRNPALGVTRALGVRLAKLLDVVEREVVAVEIGEGILQDARVTTAHNEPVSVAPERVRGVVSHHATPEHDSQRRQRHGRSGVSRVGFERCVHRQSHHFTNGSPFEVAGTGIQRVSHD